MGMKETKICKVCKNILLIEEFPMKKFPNGNFRLKTCIVCYRKKDAESKRKRYKKNPDKIKKSNKKYYINHKDSVLKQQRTRYRNNKQRINFINSIYRKKNIDKIREYERNRRANKKDHINNIKSTYDKNKRKNNCEYKIRKNVSRLINLQIKKTGYSKNNLSIFNFLPYSLKDLKVYLEKKFESWMTWDNYGTYRINLWDDNDPSTWTWNIDHIIPQSKLPYTSMEDDNFKKCWSLENLRPYSAKQNIIDGNKRLVRKTRGMSLDKVFSYKIEE